MPNVIPLRATKATFIVTVVHDEADGMWVATCDDLCLVTEAGTYEALIDRAWQIAPELAMENGLCIHESRLRLLFQHDATPHAIAL